MLSKKTQYAFKALIYLAQHQDNDPVLIAEISKKKNIPIKFLENILLELKKAGILESKKGKGGGYFFKSPPSSIPLAKVMRTVEGPIALLPCVSLNFYEKCKDCEEEVCGLNRVMIEVRDASLKILEGKTVADLAMLS
ncbi:MAG: Rrf2 family transcriptional regulator [Sphingobacteriales bacterium]|uniref:RrF2 family transcriptional regulator n=1 Tax=Hydrotalea flava TaxID=714549 RepID=UPI00082F6E2E|nr:Rrf2 family transcriptional regulator [Hydrotalea flava]RTL47217.1 MAG: Rrf2 family transcriptional regulator [Sphingobacteriales bacterium]